jgi:hypothetical protein
MQVYGILLSPIRHHRGRRPYQTRRHPVLNAIAIRVAHLVCFALPLAGTRVRARNCFLLMPCVPCQRQRVHCTYNINRSWIILVGLPLLHVHCLTPDKRVHHLESSLWFHRSTHMNQILLPMGAAKLLICRATASFRSRSVLLK